MLNENAYQATYDEKVRLACPFEKAILCRCADCDRANKFNIAEREAVACTSAPARENCLMLHALLHQNAAFALRLAHVDEPLPHAKEIRVQCGGLRGLRRLLDQDASSAGNVHALTGDIQRRFGTMQAVPYQEVVRDIAAYEGRRRR